MEAGPAPEAAPVTPARQLIQLEFRASGSEYFRIWIVNLLLTLLTLGVYSAWAKVRRQRYLYGNTYIAGTAFEYHGKPLQILKGRLIAVGALLLYWLLTTIWPAAALVLILPFIAALPWVIVRSRLFQMHMTSWRNIRFRFNGTYGGAFAAYIGWAIPAVFTGYILMPLWIYQRVRYLLSNTSYGTEPFVFNTSIGTYFKFYFLTVLFGIIAFVAWILALGVLGKAIPWEQVEALDPTAMALVVPAAVAGLLLVLVIAAYYERSFVNAAYDGLMLGPHKLHCELETGRLAGIYVTNLLGMMLTLGLFFPWAKIRRLRYQFERMQLNALGALDEFSAAAAPQTSATGEAVGEIFEVEFGL